MHSFPVITLKKGKERSILQKHPWIFSGAIAKEPKNLEEGDIVIVNSNEGNFLATGHFHKGTITVRCFDFENKNIDQDFWTQKISKAWDYRKSLGLIDNKYITAFRLIHGEGDGFPGLVADMYENTLILQTYTAGMHRLKKEIVNAIIVVSSGRIKAIYDKSSDTMAKQDMPATDDGYLWKDNTYSIPEFILENDLKFKVDWINGQKTGFFIDQRFNRELLKSYSKNKSVLNAFCYTGGFSVYALSGNAKLVHSVDSSKKAIEGTNTNVKLNFQGTNHEAFSEDVMSFLKKPGLDYDIMILDPPAFAKHQSNVKNAMVGYRNLNTEGMKRMNPGGILFTFSCSQAIDRELFRKIIFQAALQAGKNVRIMHQLSQPADHPVNVYHPEAEYLKGLILYIEEPS